ncbi:hypothetical protein CP083_04835 [Candidatus Bathyarchaeota archaeon B24-2]|nr:MAG: hypothetical protein CP083_04835 [Candidatus Bathyarchaeota archaeon B24-2]
MQASIEYIIAGLTILSILVVAETNMLTLIVHTLTDVQQEVSYGKAEEILDTLLLSPGYPPDWGADSEVPELMGLAVQSSTEEYILDPKKVLRLTEYSDHYIPPATTRSILGLDRGYQFSLRIIPFFIITINNQGNGTYTISVVNYRGVPASNVNVTGYYIPIPFRYNATYQIESAITGVDGTCTLTFDYTPNSTLLVCASQLGVESLAAEESNLNLKVKNGYVVESETPIIASVEYSTGALSQLKKDVITKFVKIDGYTYYVDFILWR